MAKDSIPESAAIPNPESPAAPLFAFARTVLDEMDRESERWLEQGATQSREAVAAIRTVQQASLGITRTMLVSIEGTTAAMMAAAQSCGKPFFKVGA